MKILVLPKTGSGIISALTWTPSPEANVEIIFVIDDKRDDPLFEPAFSFSLFNNLTFSLSNTISSEHEVR